jgi:hypothetical protein
MYFVHNILFLDYYVYNNMQCYLNSIVPFILVFDPRKNAVFAVREQYPLKPAYALTIHKSQGMTLER